MPQTGIGPAVGWTSLHDAAKSDDLEALICSVEAKKGMPIRDVDMPSATGLTPLHVAGMHGSTLCIPYLVSMNSDLTIVDHFGRLALHYAAESGHLSSCMQLVASGQDLNAQDNDGNTPLHMAARGSSKASKYLIEIGANLSIRNNRGWTPLQSASVPMYRSAQEILEESIPLLQKIRRDADPIEVQYLLKDCNMTQFEPLFSKAGYGSQHLFVSCRPVSLTVLNNCAETKVDMMSVREYLFFLENLSRWHGVEKRNPFMENAQKQRYWDEHPDEFEAFLAENPGYDASNIDDSEWTRPVLDKEEEYMDFLHQVTAELRQADKLGVFSNMMTRTGPPVTGADGRVYVDSELMYKGIQDIVDNGWRDTPVIDFEQIEKNIDDGMYGLWEQFALDFMLMVCNAFVYFRAAKSDMEEGYKMGVALLARGQRVIRKHRTAMSKLAAAAAAERVEHSKQMAGFWTRWSTDKRLRGMLPDLWREAHDIADEEEDDTLVKMYMERFESIEDADAFWGGGPSKNMFEASRIGWEQDSRCVRGFTWIKWALDVAASRDVGMHLQHPQADPRSDMHMPGADFSLAKTREGEGGGSEEEQLRQNFIREIVWPMDFDSMRARVTHDPRYDLRRNHPDDYSSVDQVLLGFLVILGNIIIFHDKHHLHMKAVLDQKQQPPYLVPKAPIRIRVDPAILEPFKARILWDQPTPKPKEVVESYEIELITAAEQDTDPKRTMCVPNKVEYILSSIDDDERPATSRPPSSRPVTFAVSEGGAAKMIQQGQLLPTNQDLEDSVDQKARHRYKASSQGGWCDIVTLSPSTLFHIYMRAITRDGVYGPASGPVLTFKTPPHHPEMVPNLVARHVTVDLIVFAWDAPRDNGSNIIDYEVEYTDVSFGSVYTNKVGYDARNVSTALVQVPPGSDDPLGAGYLLPPRESNLLPATTVLSRVRARNGAGWGPWVSPMLKTCTIPDMASPAQAVAITGTGSDHIEVSWMPPVRSNSLEGIQGYRVSVRVMDGEEAGMTLELDMSIDDLVPIVEEQRPISSRPSTSMSKSGMMARTERSRANSTPSGSRQSSASRRRRERDEEVGVIAADDDAIDNSDGSSGDSEVELDEVDIRSSRPATPARTWWQTTPFCGKVWFATSVPTKVIERALLDYPTIGLDNNLIVLQTRGPVDWEAERYAVVPPMAYRAEQLANRLQRCFQDLLPPELGLRFLVTNSSDDHFRFSLNRQFRLKMPPSLLYALGLVRSSGGWVVSPPIKNVGLADDKSVILAPFPHKLAPAICDLVPIRIPHVYKIEDLPPGSTISVEMRAKNGAGKIYGDVDSLGRPSEKVSIRTEPVAPPPPREVIAKGVLSSAITINWKPPTTNNGSVIARFILEYEIEGDGPYRRAFDPLTEGCQISNLTPGQKVYNIRLCSESDAGLAGPTSADEIASRAPTRPSTKHSEKTHRTTVSSVRSRGSTAANQQEEGVWARALCEVTSAPFNLEPIESTSTSITFGWQEPLFDGGSPIIEWELRGYRQDGQVFEEYFPHPCGGRYTVSNLPERPSVGEMLLAVTVRARNDVGWSAASNRADGKAINGPPPHPDRMNKFMRDKSARQSEAVAGLARAIAAGEEAERAAEKAALQPMRLKKAMMEEAENMVLVAEKLLIAAIAESEDCGITAIGVAKPDEDVNARLVLERLRLKRARRWVNRRTRGGDV